MVQVVLVDENDNQTGLDDKVSAHLGEGKLHRAFTILLFNSNNETLVVQRSAEKMLWPLYWDSACASHPVESETQVGAGKRRLVEELGFTCWLDEVDKFQYKEKYGDIGSENEVCTTLIGKYDGEINLNPHEATAYKWMSIDNLKSGITENPDKYTIWFKIALNRLIKQGKIK